MSAEERQQLVQDAIVTLFEINARSVGEGLLRFSPEPLNGGPVLFDGNEYTPLPIQAEGFEVSGQGKLPRPSLTVTSLSLSFLSLVIAADDLVGLPIRRLRIYRRHLDDGTDPDPQRIWPVDHYVFERKARHNPRQGILKFELAVQMDQEGRKIPARPILRDTCTHTYRRWNAQAGAFDYTNATCPYSGSACFNRGGESVPAQEDECGKRLSDCRLRFGQNGRLPTRQFPGVGRVR